MSNDQRARLEARLKQLQAWFDTPAQVPVAGSPEWQVTQASTEQQSAVEIALAQLDVAEATREAASAQRELAQAQDRATSEQEREKAAKDDATFWFRRFILGLSIAHGAAIAAITAGVFQANDPVQAAKLIDLPYALFAIGLLGAGATPLVLWRERSLPKAAVAAKARWEGVAIGCVMFSGALFATALVLSSKAVSKLGASPTVDAAALKAVSSPPPPKAPAARPAPSPHPETAGTPSSAKSHSRPADLPRTSGPG